MTIMLKKRKVNNMLELKLKKRNITMNELLKLGLKPECLCCIHSTPEGLLQLSCNIKNDKVFSYTQNICGDECATFEADFNEYFSSQNEDILITYRNEHYMYKKKPYPKAEL